MSGFEWVTLVGVAVALSLIGLRWLRMRPGLQERRQRAGLQALQQDNLEHALLCFEQVIGVDSMAFAARYNRALALMRLGRLAEARQGFDELLVDFPGYTRAMLGRAELLQRTGDSAAALADLDRAMHLDPTLADIYLLRAHIYASADDLDHAISDLRIACELAPTSLAAQANLAVLLVASKDYAAAQPLLAALLVTGGDPRLWLAQAELLEQQQEHQAAWDALSEVLSQQPELTAVRLRRAFIALTLHLWAEARADFDAVLHGEPDSLAAAMGRSGAALMLGDLRQAADDVAMVLAHEPGSPEALRQRALLRFFNDELEAALPDALAAIQLAPPNPMAAALAARILRAQERFEAAQSLLQETLALFGSDEPAMLAEYALVLAAQRADPELYMPRLRTLLASMPEDSELLSTLAWLQCLENRPVLALPYAQRLIAQHSEGLWRDTRGLASALLERFDTARSDWEAVVADLSRFDAPFFQRTVARRQHWLDQIAAGEQPITSATLDELRRIV